MGEELEDVLDPAALDQAMAQLFRLRGMLDPSPATSGLGVSVSEAMALARLAEGPTSQQRLAIHLALEKSTVSRLVDAMVAKGWVSKAKDPDNRRFQIVKLTPAGSAEAAAVTDAIRRRRARILSALTPEERRAVAVALPALVRAIAAET